MSKLTLPEALPIFSSWLARIREHDSTRTNDLLIENILAAEQILASIPNALGVRNTARAYSGVIASSPSAEGDPESIVIGGRSFNFDHVRRNALAGLFAATWGVYDNFTQVGRFLLDLDREDGVPQNMLGVLEHKNPKISGHVVGPMRKKYRYALSLSYQIRNSISHRLIFGGREQSFLSLFPADGFRVKAESYKSLNAYCQKKNEIKPAEIEALKIVDGSDQCLLAVYDALLVHTDACAVEFLEAAVKPLIPLELLQT